MCCLSSWHALYAEAGGVAGHQGGVPTGEEGRGVDGEDRRLGHHQARPLGDLQLRQRVAGQLFNCKGGGQSGTVANTRRASFRLG